MEEDGRRRSVHPDGGPTGEDAYSIAMFGGSTMLGWGARDVFTIPSLVAQLAEHEAPNGPHVQVTNLGRDGYVSNQEVILLEERLKAGRPSLVLFYDGVNEVETAIARQRAGETYEEATLRESNEGRRRPRRQAARALLVQSSTFGVMRALHRIRTRPTELEAKLSATDLDRLADEVVAVYLANVGHVRKLAAGYGFSCLFYWQPILYTKAHPTAYEQSLFARRWYEDGPPVSSDVYRALWIKIYERVRALSQPYPEFHDLSRIFDRDKAPRFIDPQHLGESGNEVVAHRRMDDIGPLLRAAAGPAANASSGIVRP